VASVSSAHLVLFIAAVVVAAALAGTMTNSASRIGEAVQDRAVDDSEAIDGEIRIVSDAESPGSVYNDTAETLTLYVKNTGAGTLPSAPEDVTVLVDGAYQSNVSTTVLEASEWRSGELLRVQVNVSLPANTQTRVVVQSRGARDLFVFTTP
jgi:flagellar protein FlaG